MDTLTPIGTQERLGKDFESLKVLSREELHSYLIAEPDLEKIDTEVESLGYLVLKKKDETAGIYSLRTHSLLPFPGRGGGKPFLKLSGAETDKEEYVYMSLGGVETTDDVTGILAFFTLKDDIIEEHMMKESMSLATAILIFATKNISSWLKDSTKERELETRRREEESRRSSLEFHTILGLLGNDRVIH